MLETFVRYAAAFEQAYESRDFTVLEPFFTEDAVYETYAPGLPNQRHEGRASVLGYLEWMTECFDQRFESRQLFRVSGPEVKDGVVELHGIAVYTLETGERCHLSLTEDAHFEGDRIFRLVDHLSLGAATEMKWIVEKYPDRFPAALLKPPHS